MIYDDDGRIERLRTALYWEPEPAESQTATEEPQPEAEDNRGTSRQEAKTDDGQMNDATTEGSGSKDTKTEGSNAKAEDTDLHNAKTESNGVKSKDEHLKNEKQSKKSNKMSQ